MPNPLTGRTTRGSTGQNGPGGPSGVNESGQPWKGLFSSSQAAESSTDSSDFEDSSSGEWSPSRAAEETLPKQPSLFVDTRPDFLSPDAGGATTATSEGDDSPQAPIITTVPSTSDVPLTTLPSLNRPSRLTPPHLLKEHGVPRIVLRSVEGETIEKTVDSGVSGRLSTFPLWEEDGTNRAAISSWLIDEPPTRGFTSLPQPLSATATSAAVQSSHKTHRKKKFGTFRGVYIPCVQSMLGVIVFTRMTWVVGVSGVRYALLHLAMSLACTGITTTSMAAIATNGLRSPGGPYYMISRSLGKEFGGSAGVLLYLSLCMSISLIALGATEVLIGYGLPSLSLGSSYANGRVYGTALLFLMTSVQLLPFKHIFTVSNIFFVATLVTLVSITVGVLPFNLRVGLDDVLDGGQMTDVILFPWPGDLAENWAEGYDKRNVYGDIVNVGLQDEGSVGSVDASSSGLVIFGVATVGFLRLFAIFFPSMTGFLLGAQRSGNLKTPAKSITKGTIWAIATTSGYYLFFILMYGSFVRGEWLRTKKPETAPVIALVSWPHPTATIIGIILSAIGTGLHLCIGAPRMMAFVAKDDILPFLTIFTRNYHFFGHAHKKRTSPVKGKFTGHSSESMLPRYQRVLLWLKKITTRRRAKFQGFTLKSSHLALLLTFLLAEIGILVGDLDLMAIFTTVASLLTYMFINVSTALLSFTSNPNWRPTFTFHHWLLSLSGTLLCVTYMFLIHWPTAIFALAMVLILFKYISWRGASVTWGSEGLDSLSMQVAKQNLLDCIKRKREVERGLRRRKGVNSERAKEPIAQKAPGWGIQLPSRPAPVPAHAVAQSYGNPKNWRPQVICFVHPLTSTPDRREKAKSGTSTPAGPTTQESNFYDDQLTSMLSNSSTDANSNPFARSDVESITEIPPEFTRTFIRRVQNAERKVRKNRSKVPNALYNWRLPWKRRQSQKSTELVSVATRELLADGKLGRPGHPYKSRRRDPRDPPSAYELSLYSQQNNGSIRMMSFLSQMKKGTGLTMVATVLAGEFLEFLDNDENHPFNLANTSSDDPHSSVTGTSGEKAEAPVSPAEAVDAAKSIRQQTKLLEKADHDLRLHGFSEVLVAPSVTFGITHTIQAAGLGPLRPNTVMLGFPTKTTDTDSVSQFVQTVKHIIAYEKALLVLKNPHNFPLNGESRKEGTIDVYLIVHDGGLLCILPHLLKKSHIWRRCPLRIFAIAQLEDNSLEMKKRLQVSLQHLRIEAETDVLEISDDLNEFIYERTLRMERRHRILEDIQKRTPKSSQAISPLFNAFDHKSTNTYIVSKRKLELLRTSLTVNALMRERSSEAAMVFCNLPAPTQQQTHEEYVEYLDALTSGLDRVVLVKGNGYEVVTSSF